jgi:NADH-quinone oxidoreductase subunit A
MPGVMTLLSNLILPLAQQTPDPRASWAPVVLMIVIALGFAIGNVVLSLLIGPSRQGPGKSQTYESGMTPVGTAHKRFNVRFYIVAMIFLVIDVDIIFFYPWATIFAPYATAKGVPPSVTTTLLVEMIVFVLLLLLAYVYAWGKGVFRWD